MRVQDKRGSRFVLCPGPACRAGVPGTRYRDGSGGSGPRPGTAVRPCGGTHRVGGGLGDSLSASHSLRGGGCAQQRGEGTGCRRRVGGARRGGWAGAKEGGALVPGAHTGQLGQRQRGGEGPAGSCSGCAHRVGCPRGEVHRLEGIWHEGRFLRWPLGIQCRQSLLLSLVNRSPMAQGRRASPP